MNRTAKKIFVLGAAAIMVVMGGSLIYRRVLAPASAVVPDPVAYPIRGVDLSAHNGDVDFDRVASDGISFALLKATEGTDFKDSRFAENYDRARNVGLRVGAYHFFRFDTDGRLQAINLLHSVRNREVDFPLVIDVEEWGNPDAIATSEIVGRLRDMISHLRYFGRDVMIYTNKDGYERFVRGNFDDYPLWLCSFTEIDPTINWHLWQYTHRGRVAGVGGNVDISVMPASVPVAPN